MNSKKKILKYVNGLFTVGLILISLVSCAKKYPTSEKDFKPDVYTSAIVHLLKEKKDVEVTGDFSSKCKEGDTVLVMQNIYSSGRRVCIYSWCYLDSPVSIRDTVFSSAGDIYVYRNAVIYLLRLDED